MEEKKRVEKNVNYGGERERKKNVDPFFGSEIGMEGNK